MVSKAHKLTVAAGLNLSAPLPHPSRRDASKLVLLFLRAGKLQGAAFPMTPFIEPFALGLCADQSPASERICAISAAATSLTKPRERLYAGSLRAIKVTA